MSAVQEEALRAIYLHWHADLVKRFPMFDDFNNQSFFLLSADRPIQYFFVYPFSRATGALYNRVVKSWIADEKDKRLSHTDERVDRYGWSSMT